jgi:uncharacterized protein
MVKALPQRFNPDLLARDETPFELVLPQSQLPRLGAIVSSDDNDVQISAVFSRQKKFVLISGRVSTQFTMECQRCLEQFDVEIDEPFQLAFVESEERASKLPDELDHVVLDDSGSIHVVDLFQDEVIFHVPDIPKHSDLTTCTLHQTEFGEVAAEVKEGTRNPFEALKNLNLH